MRGGFALLGPLDPRTNFGSLRSREVKASNFGGNILIDGQERDMSQFNFGLQVVSKGNKNGSGQIAMLSFLLAMVDGKALNPLLTTLPPGEKGVKRGLLEPPGRPEDLDRSDKINISKDG